MSSISAINKIYLPSRPQPDTIVAIFLLREFGGEKFPGVKNAKIAVMQSVPRNSEEEFGKEGVLLLDSGGGKFDHHFRKPKTTSSKLVADFLGVAGRESIEKLLAYAERDDFYGKGTVSDDPLDRAFGLSALITALNKSNPADPNYVVEKVLPLLEAHYKEEERRAYELPAEVEKLRAGNKFKEFFARQKDKKLRCVIIYSDNPSIAGYLRSQSGGRYDVVVQRGESGHTNILTRPTKRVDLRMLAAYLRVREAELRVIDVPDIPVAELTRPGRYGNIKEWYYDDATNSLQNGGLSPIGVEPTAISTDEIEKLVTKGLENI